VMENANAEFHAFMEMGRTLAGIHVSRTLAEDMTMHLFKTGTKDADKVKESRGFIRVMELFNGAAKGAALETAQETAWGYLNSVTEYVDHWVRAQSDENRTASALWGQGNDLKTRAMELVTSLA
jgi:hypothetical protein